MAHEQPLNAGSQVAECSECGHMHFDTDLRFYFGCPLRIEGCGCPNDPNGPRGAG